ncbi:MAG: hypothetical protein ACKO7W_07405 [Elainella sp.]
MPDLRLPDRRPNVRVLLTLVTLLLALLLGGTRLPALAQSPPGNQVDGYPVMLDGNELFRVNQGIAGVVSAEERARVISERLLQVANNSAVTPEAIRVEEQDNSSVVMADDMVLFTVRAADQEGDQSHQAMAEKSVQSLRSALGQYRQDRSVKQILQGVLFAALSTIGLISFLLLLQRFTSRLLIRIRAARQADRLDLRSLVKIT